MGISSSILNGLLMGGIYALMALGLVLIYGVMRMINLALGPLIVLAGFITFSLSILSEIYFKYFNISFYFKFTRSFS